MNVKKSSEIMKQMRVVLLSALLLASAFSANAADTQVIQFFIEVTNNYIGTGNSSIQLRVMAGAPTQCALMIDNANHEEAAWLDYTSSNFPVYLGEREGWHQIWVGLKGAAGDLQQSWQCKRLKFQTSPPSLVITSPTNTVLTEPMIQLKGYSPSALGSISYDLTNGIGLKTDQPVLILDQHYSVESGEFTTNTFQAFDIPLTNGLNVITLHATDLAGNATEKTLNYTVDYSSKTNPPIFSIEWPKNGDQVSGPSFSCRGWVNDPTVTIEAQFITTNIYPNMDEMAGQTNAYQHMDFRTNELNGFVGRNGELGLELPLHAGTNSFTIFVVDKAGNTSITNLSVVQSTVVLTIDPVTPASQLWNSRVNLSGKISDPNQAVWVNGVKGHNNGDGTWSAKNVPNNVSGQSTFDATAYEPNEKQPDGSYGN